MLNKEKYLKEIMDVVCSGDRIAVKKETNEVVGCSTIQCKNCLFGGEACGRKIEEWCNSEYKEPVVISATDLQFLYYIESEEYYIARDMDGRLCLFEQKPDRLIDCWDDMKTFSWLPLFVVEFPMIKWNGEPWQVKDLKELGVVAKYK